MKILSRIVLFVTLACVLYTAMWFYQAHQIRKQIEPEIEKISAAYFPDSKITHDATRVDGFPFNFRAVLCNPKIEPRDSAQKERFQYALDGEIVLTFSPLGKLRYLDLHGKSVAEVFQTNQMGSFCTTHEADTTAHCFSDKEPLDCGSVRCLNYKMNADMHIGRHLQNVSEGTLSVSYKKRPADSGIQLEGETTFSSRLQEAAVQNQAAPAARELAEFIKSLCGDSEQTQSHFEFALDIPNLALMRKLYFIDEATLDAFEKNPLALFDEPLPPVSLEIKNCTLQATDSAHKMNMSFNLSEAKNGTISSSLSLDGSANVSPRTYEAFKGFFKSAFIKAPRNRSNKSEELFVNNIDNFLTLFPNLPEWGMIDFASSLQLTYNKLSHEFALKDGNFSLRSNAFDIAVKADISDTHSCKESNLLLTLNRPQEFVRMVCDYYNRVIALVNLFQTDIPALMPLSEHSNQAIVAFLSTLSTSANDKSYCIPITIAKDSFSIGNLSTQELQESGTQLFATLIQETYPALLQQQ